MKKEGKTVISYQISSYLNRLNYKTIVIQFLPGCKKTPSNIKSTINIGELNAIHKSEFYLTQKDIEELKQNFDYIIFDNPATSIELTGVKNMLISDVNIFVSKSNYTKNTYLNNPDHLVDEFEIKNIYLVLNCVHRSTNYDGKYILNQSSIIRNIRIKFGEELLTYITHILKIEISIKNITPKQRKVTNLL